MGRFDDAWVVERTLFDFVAGGSCACCGLPLLFNPEGIKGLIMSVSDLETDAADAELKAIESIDFPWKPDLRDQVWGDRVLLRHKMKREMRRYRDFMDEVKQIDCQEQKREDDDHDDMQDKDELRNFKLWMRKEIGTNGLQRIFQMPRMEVPDNIIKDTYNIHSAYRIVLIAITEQVANFEKTGYTVDAKGSEEELAFERALQYDRRAGFILNLAPTDDDEKEYTTNDRETFIVNMFANVMDKWLGGIKLLQRGPSISKSKKNNQNDQDKENDDDDSSYARSTSGPSFRGDRRLCRLLIARYWADQIMWKWKHMREKVSNS
mmetsp:Transcript_7132/g.10221  ORF Transcript_7132/g.10221 Transcript_7132/m.10221 type:complete len:321 (-) Transcript_7132:43-1005(-)